MPAAAVASRTPSMAGTCGVDFGARGETAVAMRWTSVGWTEVRWVARMERSEIRDEPKSRTAVPALRFASCGLLLRSRSAGRHHGRGYGQWRRRRMVEALDLGGLAQLGNVFGLGAAHQIGVDLLLDRLQLRHRPLPLVLDLDDVPAEL